MPVYTHQCTQCKHSQDERRKVDQRDKPGTCEVCAAQTQREGVERTAKMAAQWAKWQQ